MRVPIILLAALTLVVSVEARTTPIQVGIALNVEEARIEVTGDAECSGVAEIRRLARGDAFTARVSRGRILLQPTRASDDLAVYEVADTFRVKPLAASTFVQINGKRYRGGAQDLPLSGGKGPCRERGGDGGLSARCAAARDRAPQ
jgi:hypothetical protein